MPFKKLKLEEHGSAEALIHAIEQKDRRFRLFQTLFMVGTFIALIVIISAQQRTLDGVQAQLDQAKKVAQDQSQQSDESQATILRRLDCMSVFFSQRDRTNLSIENIDKCTLNRDGDLQQFFTQQPGEEPQTTREQQAPSNLTPSTPPRQDEGAVTDPPADQPEVIEPRPPVTLDLPLIQLPSTCVLQILCVQ